MRIAWLGIAVLLALQNVQLPLPDSQVPVVEIARNGALSVIIIIVLYFYRRDFTGQQAIELERQRVLIQTLSDVTKAITLMSERVEAVDENVNRLRDNVTRNP